MERQALKEPEKERDRVAQEENGSTEPEMDSMAREVRSAPLPSWCRDFPLEGRDLSSRREE